MTDRLPLVRVGGKNTQIPAGDALRLRGPLSEATVVAVSTPASENINAAVLAGNTYSVTGAGAISYLNNASQTGPVRRMIFNTAGIIIRHLGGNLRLPGATAITTQAGDVAEFVQDTTNTWRCTSYTRADGTALVGGSGGSFTGGKLTADLQFADRASIAAAATTDLSSVNSNLVTISSAGTITSFGTGIVGDLKFVLVGIDNTIITRSSSTLEVPGKATITAMSGDFFIAECVAANSWRVRDYQRADGTALVGGVGDFKANGSVPMTGPFNQASYTAMAASASMNIGGASSDTIRIDSGAAAITAFTGGTAGMRRILYFNTALTLTHSSGLVIPGSASITTAVRDFCEVVMLSANEWEVVWYQRRDGTSLVGSPDASKVPLAAVGAANGVAPLGADSKIAAAYLPSYVDDVLEYANLAAFPVTGESGKIYIAVDTNREYRWSGSVYTAIVASPGTTDNVPEGTTNLYFTAARVLDTALSGLSLLTGSAVVATDSIIVAIGKLQAQNTAQDAAISGKEPTIAGGSVGQYWNGLKSFTDFATSVRAAALTGLSLATNSAITATDTVLTALGKLQAQLNASVSRTETITTTSVGQTSYSVPNGYVVGAINVFLNGVLLAPSDYTATDGTTVVLASGALTTNDIMSVLVIGSVRAQDDALLQYTVSALPAASANAFKQRWCTNMAGGAGVVVSNGTNWLRVADNTVVTT